MTKVTTSFWVLIDLVQRLESYEADGNRVAAIQVRNRIVDWAQAEVAAKKGETK